MNDVHDRSAAFALDGLDGLDRLSYESHLTQCPRCRGDVEDLRDAAELLSAGIELPVPISVRERVQAVTRTAPEPLYQDQVPDADAAGGRPRRRRWFG
ncbi:zf-HC2 domain-containing protein [Nocardioides houyundeii]|uniref:zf-HC2 domain-containing protein n=1 Tax=Nocardioides houyundeii TaxID=2045452 RepID=UPI000DF1D76D|nr:zf-HC2 domain-containing protein [Nocardioides houyundeii]